MKGHDRVEGKHLKEQHTHARLPSFSLIAPLAPSCPPLCNPGISHIHFTGLKRSLACQVALLLNSQHTYVPVLPLGSRLWLCLEYLTEFLFYGTGRLFPSLFLKSFFFFFADFERSGG